MGPMVCRTVNCWGGLFSTVFIADGNGRIVNDGTVVIVPDSDDRDGLGNVRVVLPDGTSGRVYVRHLVRIEQ